MYIHTSGTQVGCFEYNIEFLRDALSVAHNSCSRYCCPICFLHCTYFVYLLSKHIKQIITEEFIAHYFLSALILKSHLNTEIKFA